jgi:hypothetical protein
VIASWHSSVLDEAITERHSTRMFLPQSVPRALVDESSPWPSMRRPEFQHPAVAYGTRVRAARDRLVAALLDEARRRPPKIPPLPESFQHYRRELGDGNRPRGHGEACGRSFTGYPEIVRAQLAIPAQLSILCGWRLATPIPTSRQSPAHQPRVHREEHGVP